MISAIKLFTFAQVNKNKDKYISMLPIEDQVSILVHISKADKFVDEAESKMIHRIGKAGGLSQQEVENIIDNPKKIANLRNLPSDEKFNYLYNTIQLMKVDKRVHQKEIAFCEVLAMNLGYKPGVVGELSQYIFSDPNTVTNLDFLKNLADQHIISY